METLDTYVRGYMSSHTHTHLKITHMHTHTYMPITHMHTHTHMSGDTENAFLQDQGVRERERVRVRVRERERERDGDR